jgi:alpha-D-ribose 1-methylphosphonate 5-triphosphate synthase subunit PhnG
MNTATEPADRKDRMSVLARSDASRLQELWTGLGLDPGFRPVRGPERGLVMLRGRIGGTGEPFNIGEATVTRASVALEDGSVGHAVTLGRDGAKARLSAVIDALCGDRDVAALIEDRMIAPLRRELAAADERKRQETAATRVDFFTMARGED